MMIVGDDADIHPSDGVSWKLFGRANISRVWLSSVPAFDDCCISCLFGQAYTGPNFQALGKKPTSHFYYSMLFVFEK
jgi:hypothetical protein